MTNKKFYLAWLNELTSLGGMVFYLINIVILLAKGLYIHVFWLIIGLIMILGSFYLIRFFYFKERPVKKKKGKSLLTRLDASSFPSVHAARITFLCITYIYLINEIYFRILFIFIWVLVLLSRYLLKKHYLIDVVVGSLLSVIYFYFISEGTQYVLKLLGL